MHAAAQAISKPYRCRLHATTGSMLEGGGQILRNAGALAAITGQSIRVNNIRAGRRKPGLSPQHVTGLQLVARIAGAQLVNTTVGASFIELQPTGLTGGQHAADIGTAGSCALLAQVNACAKHLTFHTGTRPCSWLGLPAAVLPATASWACTAAGYAGACKQHVDAQAALPCLIMAPSPAGSNPPGAPWSVLELRGGTDAAFAPPIGYLQHVLLPLLRGLFGIHAELEVGPLELCCAFPSHACR